jgi:hypothetical protein
LEPIEISTLGNPEGHKRSAGARTYTVGRQNGVENTMCIKSKNAQKQLNKIKTCVEKLTTLETNTSATHDLAI